MVTNRDGCRPARLSQHAVPFGARVARNCRDPRAAPPRDNVEYCAVMARVLVTGMSGAGKTTVLDELRRREHMTVDTDYDGWELYDGTWDGRRMEWLLASESDVVVSGTVENQGRFYDRFEYVVLLSAPLDALLERVSRSTNNAYGNCTEHQAEIAHFQRTVELLLRRGSSLELDGRRPVPELADAIA